MKPNYLSIICMFLLPLLTPAAAAGEPAADQKIPLAAFTQSPRVGSVQLSPDGKYIAMLRPIRGTTYLLTQKLYSGEKPVLVVRNEKEKNRIRWYKWANDERLLVSVGFAGSRRGVPLQESRLVAINRDGSKLENIVKDEGNRGRPARWETQFRDKVISLLPDDKEHILIGLDHSKPGFDTVYKLNIYTGQRKSVQRAIVPIRRWMADRRGNIRVGIGFQDTNITVLLRGSRSKKWVTAWEYKMPDDPGISPMGFGADPDILYVSCLHQGRQAVFIVDTSKETLEKKLVFSDPDEDIGGGLIVSSKTNDAIGVYYRSETGRNRLWDAAAIAFQEEIDSQLPGLVNHIVSSDRDETRHIIYSRSAVHPGTYYLRAGEKGTLTKLSDTYPELGPANLVGKKPVTYTARDGLQIEGYLTLPKGENKDPLPAVIYPHGGPGIRNYLAFDLWTEFLASRGYAVLQMNFRGSAGYGVKFFKAGVKGWGLEMQDDITDGTKWLIDQGIADPDRICILGASYGGYAALMGAVKTPDLYRCAVSFAGVSDLRMFLDHQRMFMTKGFVREQIGDRRKDKKRLIATSPAKQVEKIKIPIFIAHGDWDRVVRIKQSEVMVKALKKKGKDYEYLRLERGDHSLSLQENRTLFFERLEAFLGKHLGS